jgi:hypothetical protein
MVHLSGYRQIFGIFQICGLCAVASLSLGKLAALHHNVRGAFVSLWQITQPLESIFFMGASRNTSHLLCMLDLHCWSGAFALTWNIG